MAQAFTSSGNDPDRGFRTRVCSRILPTGLSVMSINPDRRYGVYIGVWLARLYNWHTVPFNSIQQGVWPVTDLTKLKLKFDRFRCDLWHVTCKKFWQSCKGVPGSECRTGPWLVGCRPRLEKKKGRHHFFHFVRPVRALQEH